MVLHRVAEVRGYDVSCDVQLHAPLEQQTAQAVGVVGLGEAVNELARAGLSAKHEATRFRQRTVSVGLKVDVTDIAATLELLDQYDAEDAR